MSRKDEVCRAACRQYAGITHRKAFVQGAAWADAHPDNGLDFEPKSLEECIEAATPTWKGVDVEKYIDEVRGRDEQPVDLRYMAGMRAGRDAAIEMACDWLKEFSDNHYIMDYTDSHEVTEEELLEHFRKAMEEY